MSSPCFSFTLTSNYFFGVAALEWTTGNWRDICLDGIQVRPRDDALQSIDTLSICDPFLMITPHQEFELAKQPRWILAKEHVQQASCPLAPEFLKKAQVEVGEGTIVVRVFCPPHDLFVQRPFPVVLSAWSMEQNHEQAD